MQFVQSLIMNVMSGRHISPHDFTTENNLRSEGHMFNLRKILVLTVAAALLCQPVFALSGDSLRLVPRGSVKILETGVEVDQEMPAPAGMLMACKGQCYIEAGGMRLVGADGTVFALQETVDGYSVMIREGSLDFALSADSGPLEFKTPFDDLHASPYSLPASSDAVIRGNLRVTEEYAVLTLAQGSLELTNSRGQTLLHAGNAITMAQYSAGSGSGSDAGKGSLTGWVVGAAALGVIGASIAALSSDDGDGGDDAKDASPQ